MEKGDKKMNLLKAGAYNVFAPASILKLLTKNMTNITQKELSILSKGFHKFGHELIDKGISFIKAAFKLKPVEYTKVAIMAFLTDQLGLQSPTISLSDGKYYAVTWDKWEQIIDYDLIDTQQYLWDVFDCDNFAYAYASRAGLIYEINTCAVAYGAIYDLNGQLIGYHAFNLIVVYENGVLKLYLYEPMTDKSKVWEKGKKNILDTWEYRPTWVIMY